MLVEGQSYLVAFQGRDGGGENPAAPAGQFRQRRHMARFRYVQCDDAGRARGRDERHAQRFRQLHRAVGLHRADNQAHRSRDERRGRVECRLGGHEARPGDGQREPPGQRRGDVFRHGNARRHAEQRNRGRRSCIQRRCHVHAGHEQHLYRPNDHQRGRSGQRLREQLARLQRRGHGGQRRRCAARQRLDGDRTAHDQRRRKRQI